MRCFDNADRCDTTDEDAAAEKNIERKRDLPLLLERQIDHVKYKRGRRLKLIRIKLLCNPGASPIAITCVVAHETRLRVIMLTQHIPPIVDSLYIVRIAAMRCEYFLRELPMNASLHRRGRVRSVLS